MSLNDLFGSGGGKPKRITPYTTGTGTYIPTEDNARCFIRRQGAGGGGAGGQAGCGQSGGSGGAYVETTERIPIAGFTYAVGAKGVGGLNPSFGGTAGGATRFGNVIAPGGRGGVSNGSNNTVGQGGAFLINGDVATGNFGLIAGISGGASGNGGSCSGFAPGFSVTGTTGNGQASAIASTSGGGDSAMGKGGNGATTGADATGYGAGGGGAQTAGNKGGDGSGGYLEIWDFGA